MPEGRNQVLEKAETGQPDELPEAGELFDPAAQSAAAGEGRPNAPDRLNETSGNVGKLAEAGDAFLERFDAGSREALAFFRREWRSTRRWTVPLLAAALVFSVPSTALVGAIGQSEFGVFDYRGRGDHAHAEAGGGGVEGFVRIRDFGGEGRRQRCKVGIDRADPGLAEGDRHDGLRVVAGG